MPTGGAANRGHLAGVRGRHRPNRQGHTHHAPAVHDRAVLVEEEAAQFQLPRLAPRRLPARRHQAQLKQPLSVVLCTRHLEVRELGTAPDRPARRCRRSALATRPASAARQDVNVPRRPRHGRQHPQSTVFFTPSLAHCRQHGAGFRFGAVQEDRPVLRRHQRRDVVPLERQHEVHRADRLGVEDVQPAGVVRETSGQVEVQVTILVHEPVQRLGVRVNPDLSAANQLGDSFKLRQLRPFRTHVTSVALAQTQDDVGGRENDRCQGRADRGRRWPKAPRHDQQGCEQAKRHADVEHGLELVGHPRHRMRNQQRPAKSGQRQGRRRRPRTAKDGKTGESPESRDHAPKQQRFHGAAPRELVPVGTAGQREGHAGRPHPVKLPLQKDRPLAIFGVRVARLAQPRAQQHRAHGRQLRQSALAAERRIFAREVVAEHDDAEQQRQRAELRRPAAQRACGNGGQALGQSGRPADAPRRTAGARPPSRAGVARGDEGEIRQQQPVDVPAQQQRHAHARRQFPEAPPSTLDLEQHHAVEHQHQGEQIGTHLVGDGVAVEQQGIGGKREQRGA